MTQPNRESVLSIEAEAMLAEYIKKECLPTLSDEQFKDLIRKGDQHGVSVFPNP